ncbi:MAG: hypothetical protein FWH18_04910 [Marinilabiliaceae bacterium]|nr:hypothetical protein [Marinilabiliaceae bacterium]
MEKSILTIVLFFCLSIIFAQESIWDFNKTSSLPKREIAFSVGDDSFAPMILDRKITIKGLYSYSISYHKRSVNDRLWWGGYINANPLAISINPSVRVSYLNKPYTTLYWGVSLGVGKGVLLCPTFQITPFGFSYGKNFFASGELGIGFKGLGCFCVGYRW